MTNPFSGFEDRTYYEEYLPAEEQIKSVDPQVIKGFMEVWRDTANQLNAEKLHTQKAHFDFVSAHEKYMAELNEKLKLEDKLNKEKESKDLAIQGLNDFREQYRKEKDHTEKLRRHRDELADKVAGIRTVRLRINDYIESFEASPQEISIDLIRLFVELIDTALKDTQRRGEDQENE